MGRFVGRLCGRVFDLDGVKVKIQKQAKKSKGVAVWYLENLTKTNSGE